MRDFRNFIIAGIATLALALAFSFAANPPVTAQVPSASPPFNVDTGALITTALTGATAGPVGTVNSASQTNLDKTGVACTMTIASSSGGASTTFGIQGFDAATNTFNTLSSQVIVTSVPATPYVVAVRPGIATSSLPANYTAQNVILPRVWRAFVSVVSTGSIVSVLGCNVVK